MCGLWGFCGSSPDALIMREIAERAGTRGPHACGWAYIDTGGVVRAEKRLGRLEPHLSTIEALQSPLIIGHARLATCGIEVELEDTQPLQAGPLVIAHNGTIPDYRAHVKRANLPLSTHNDSEIILRLIEALGPGLTENAVLALKRVRGTVPHALLAARSGHFVAVTAGHPIHELWRPEGVYVCSRTFTDSAPIRLQDSGYGIIEAQVQEGRYVVVNRDFPNTEAINGRTERDTSGNVTSRQGRRRPIRLGARLRTAGAHLRQV